MIKVACVGDSITKGFTLLNPRKYSYPSLLQSWLGDQYEVRNFGVNNASARFDSDTPYIKTKSYKKSLESGPEIILLMLGSNDTKRSNWNRGIFEKDYKSIVESYLALPSPPKIYLLAPIQIHLIKGIPLMGLYPETMEGGVRPTIKRIADEFSLPFIDLKELFPDSRYAFDGVHPQKEGTRLMAEFIYNSIFTK